MNIPMNQLYSQAINQINQTTQASPLHNQEENPAQFVSMLQNSLASLENKQSESVQAVQSLVDGTADDLHTVMIKTTEAQLSLEVAVQMRNRALEAYNEIKNMQF